jgi:hypothetical protein
VAKGLRKMRLDFPVQGRRIARGCLEDHVAACDKGFDIGKTERFKLRAQSRHR